MSSDSNSEAPASGNDTGSEASPAMPASDVSPTAAAAGGPPLPPKPAAQGLQSELDADAVVAAAEAHRLADALRLQSELAQAADYRRRRRAHALQLAQVSRSQQALLFAKLARRVESGVAQAQAAGAFLEKRANASRAYAKALADLPPLMPENEPAPAPGTLESALVSVAHTTVTERDTHELLAAALLEQSGKAVAGLTKELTKALGKLNDHEKKLGRAADELLEKTEKALAGWSSAVVADPSALPAKAEADPWLLQANFLRLWSELSKALDSYNFFLTEAFSTVEQCDRRRVEGLRSAMKDALQTQHGLTVSRLGKDLEAAGQTLSKHVGDDFKAFAVRSSLVSADVDPPRPFAHTLPRQYAVEAQEVHDEFVTVASQAVASSGPPSPRATPAELPLPPDTLKVGVLEVSSVLSWKKCVFVLTRFGFLHWFAANQWSEPTDGVPLKFCAVQMTDELNKFVLAYDPPGFFSMSKKVTIRAPGGEAEMVDWLIPLRQLTKKR
eukprot:TRINITY_DN5084_c0_g1_i3.p1 TRINITY_DN5084_c0_g1~~TRINITY_DN5084_c0_g1_i3.p1  ORF type:complete len:501 (-),score=188.25 TRINITY_DN5084_c0_g1_i3:243-1745(-)